MLTATRTDKWKAKSNNRGLEDIFKAGGFKGRKEEIREKSPSVVTCLEI